MQGARLYLLLVLYPLPGLHLLPGLVLTEGGRRSAGILREVHHVKVAWCSDHIRTRTIAPCETKFGGAPQSQFHGREEQP